MVVQRNHRLTSSQNNVTGWDSFKCVQDVISQWNSMNLISITSKFARCQNIVTRWGFIIKSKCVCVVIPWMISHYTARGYIPSVESKYRPDMTGIFPNRSIILVELQIHLQDKRKITCTIRFSQIRSHTILYS